MPENRHSDPTVPLVGAADGVPDLPKTQFAGHGHSVTRIMFSVDKFTNFGFKNDRFAFVMGYVGFPLFFA